MRSHNERLAVGTRIDSRMLSDDPFVPMARAFRLGAGSVVAAHDFASAAAEDTFVALAAVDL